MPLQDQDTAVDLDALRDRLGDDEELLKELAGLYLQDEGALLGQIAAAIREGDATALRRAAHTLKGAVSNFCAPAARGAAQDLESAGADGRLDEAAALYDTLTMELARVREVLGRFHP
jgi:two-component system, sensor histidine kinase and response regulator